MTYNSSKDKQTVQNVSSYYQLESILIAVKKFGILSSDLLVMQKQIKEKEKVYRGYKEAIDFIFRSRPEQPQDAVKAQYLLTQIIPRFKALKYSLQKLKVNYQKKNSEKYRLEKEILNLVKEAGKFFSDIHNKKLNSINDVNLKRISRLLQMKKNNGSI